MVEAKKVLVVGSSELPEEYVEFAEKFGKRLMDETGYVLVTGGLLSKGKGKLPALDGIVTEAAYESIGRDNNIAQSRIMTIHPDTSVPGIERFSTGKSVKIAHSDFRTRRYSMVLTSDAIVAINGSSKGTKDIINLAYVTGKPLIPIPATNGAALESWNKYETELSKRLNLSPDDIDNLNDTQNNSNVITACFDILSRSLRPTCFVAMPFSDHPLSGVFETIEIVAGEYGYQAIRVDKEFSPGNIIESIWNSIRYSDLIIADLTNKNPNVFYEIGIGHAINKPTQLIVFSKNGDVPDDIPFDIQVQRIFPYGTIQSLRSQLGDFFQNSR